ncbi:MAG TPA: hypothetical protein VN581_11840 [Patescibacteria group bacterium]|nr:hypothetical protein [Patescibacteria group bacterium]
MFKPWLAGDVSIVVSAAPAVREAPVIVLVLTATGQVTTAADAAGQTLAPIVVIVVLGDSATV